MAGKVKQHPNKLYKFTKCGHEGLLPELGVSNNFAHWTKNTYPRGGTWRCRACERRSAREYGFGIGPAGMLGWAKALIAKNRRGALKHGYEPICITAKDLVILREKSKYCADGCGQKIIWSTGGTFGNAQLHHNHETGLVYGFVISRCNAAEGYVGKIGDSAAQARWFKYHFPDAVKELIND